MIPECFIIIINDTHPTNILSILAHNTHILSCLFLHHIYRYITPESLSTHCVCACCVVLCVRCCLWHANNQKDVGTTPHPLIYIQHPRLFAHIFCLLERLCDANALVLTTYHNFSSSHTHVYLFFSCVCACVRVLFFTLCRPFIIIPQVLHLLLLLRAPTSSSSIIQL